MNRTIKANSLATAALLALGLSAQAADMPTKYRPVPVSIYNWSGFYAGFNLGYHTGQDDGSVNANPANWLPAAVAAIDAQAPGKTKPKGFMGGLQAGYNWQINRFVFGLEADANFLTGSNTRTVALNDPSIAVGDFYTTSTKASFLATVRPRVGYAFDNWLIYGTGGLAVGTLKTTDTLGTGGGAAISTVNTSTTRTGWTAGAGVEYGFGRNWTAKVEYLHVDLGKFDTAVGCLVACATPIDMTVHHKYTDEIIRVGMNYRFGY
jgi:outer membrane immunogenic protein